MDGALRALNRFGLGARVGERAELADPRGWLLDQLDASDARLELPDLPNPEDVAGAARRLREARMGNAQPEIRAARRSIQEILGEESRAALTRRVETPAPFVERLVAFWSNHLCVSVEGKPAVVPLAGLYEREVIRPHVLGRFADMVLASARHPAMLVYLDNFQSIGPDSVGARQIALRRGRERGLNENYARELLELHTLGVDGGYTQRDVEELARILTGWTISGPAAMDGGESRQFVFRPALHQPGSKAVLGRQYAQAGEGEGEAVIRDLCAHPSTAGFLADKIVRHFVADAPPPGAVERIASVFRSTEGDLREVARAVDACLRWERDHPGPQPGAPAASASLVEPAVAQGLR
jgi:uncharacterized protein (DUF1800 family)